MRLTRAFDVERFPLKKKRKEKGQRGSEERKNTASSRVVRQNNFRNEGNNDERQKRRERRRKSSGTDIARRWFSVLETMALTRVGRSVCRRPEATNYPFIAYTSVNVVAVLFSRSRLARIRRSDRSSDRNLGKTRMSVFENVNETYLG